MSVIAKFYIWEHHEYGTGTYVQLGCVCENQLMANYATQDEDKLFSKASPSGEVRLHQAGNWSVFYKPMEYVEKNPGKRQEWYAMLLAMDEVDNDEPTFKGASAYLKVNCYSKTKFQWDGQRVELRDIPGWAKDRKLPLGYQTDRFAVIDKLSWKMTVDNPPAEAQFIPGKNYWLVFYDADNFTMQQAIAAAHGRVV